MNLKIKVAEKNEYQLWDDLVTNSPHGTIFHTMKCLKVMENHSNSGHSKVKLYPIIGYNGKTPVCILPIFHRKTPLYHTVISPPPKIEIYYLGPLVANYTQMKQTKRESIFKQFISEVDDYISHEIKPDKVEIKLVPGIKDTRPFKWNGYEIETRYDYKINLKDELKNIYYRFEKKTREDINRAKKRGLSVEEGSKSELKYIYKLYEKRMNDQNLKLSFNRKFMDDIYDVLYPENIKIFIARYNDEVVGDLVTTSFLDKFSQWIGLHRINLDSATTHSNDLLIWKTIKYAQKNGFTSYEMPWANTPRLNSFKSKFNPELIVHFKTSKFYSFRFKMLEKAYTKLIKPVIRNS